MIGTGHLADRIGRKIPIVSGMLIQAAGLAIITAGISHALAAGLAGAFLLGAGTSLVYPTLLAAVSDATHPDWRAAPPRGRPVLPRPRLRDRRLDRRHHRRPRKPRHRRRGRGDPHRHLRPAGLGIHARNPSPAGPGGNTGRPRPAVMSPPSSAKYAQYPWTVV